MPLFLDLPGAMVTQQFDSGEDELLRRLRELTPDLPIGVAFDFHGNMTERTVKLSTLVGYKSFPTSISSRPGGVPVHFCSRR